MTLEVGRAGRRLCKAAAFQASAKNFHESWSQISKSYGREMGGKKRRFVAPPGDDASFDVICMYGILA